jgi:hypothetical protein
LRPRGFLTALRYCAGSRGGATHSALRI